MHKRIFAQEQKDLCEKSFVQNVLYSESWFCMYQITHQVKRFLTQSEYKGIYHVQIKDQQQDVIKIAKLPGAHETA